MFSEELVRWTGAGEWARECWERRDPAFGRYIKEITADVWFAWSYDRDDRRILVAWSRDIDECARLARERGGYREIRQGFGDPVEIDFIDQVFDNPGGY